jgi:hypothetical protein
MSHPFLVNRWTSSSTGVDYDTDDELDGRFAFCTHAHKDHMRGIERFGRPFFASPVTKELIHLRSPDIPPGNIIALDYDRPYQLNRRLCVTVTDSGHCPGSSAFTFEGPSGNVLHTGDARWEPPTIAKLPPRLSERPGYVDRIFLDATFGGRDVLLDTFPNRAESADLARRAIYSHSPQTHPHVDVAATMLGTEPLVRDLCDYFGVELYCEPSLRERRAQLEIALGERWLIDDLSATFLELWDPRRRPSRTDAVSLRPSTQFFTVRPGAPHLRQLLEPGLVRDRADGSFRFLYSMHSSKAELRDLLSKLRPKQVTPIAGSTSGL